MTQPSEAGEQIIGTFWSLSLDEPVPTVEPSIPASFAQIGAEDAAELAQAMDYTDPGPIYQRFDAGRHCYIASVEGKIASYGWVTFDEEHIGEIGLSIRLPDGMAYIWDCATLPRYRGQRLYPALIAYILSELRRAGLRQALIGADADNLPSQTGFVRTGFLPMLDIVQTPTGTRTRKRPDAPVRLQAEIYKALGKQTETREVEP